VLSMYRDRTGSLNGAELAIALMYARIATEIVLDGKLVTSDGELAPDLTGALNYPAEVYQAQGMVAVDLDVDPGKALAIMRARAFARGQRLTDLAREIIVGTDVEWDG